MTFSRPARLLSALSFVFLLGGCAVAAPARTPAPGTLAALGSELGEFFDDTLFAHAHWAVIVRSLQTGETVFTRNAGRTFIPASNMKLITAAAVLETLGPEFRYRTQLAAGGPIRDGVLHGDLVVLGGGDPAISARFGGEPRDVFRAWADSLRSRGVQRVSGAVVGVDEYFDAVPYGAGWAWDDVHYAYSAPVAGLQFNEAKLRLHVFPGRADGEAGLLALEPPTGYVRLVNRTVTVSPRQTPRLAFAYDDAAGGVLVVSGQVPRDTVGLLDSVAVREPVRFFVTVLRETLREAGIAVEGGAVVANADEEPRAASLTPLFVHRSPPLREILPAFMKPSQNQIAEMLLKTLGRELRGDGSAAAGVTIVDSLVTAWQLPPRQLRMVDGSGLSRYNQVTPVLLVALLEQMSRSSYQDVWLQSLPVAGVDGTLRNRMRGTAAEGNVRAKTGTLTGIRALSGYVTTADGERLVFSMILNLHLLTAADADRITDSALTRLAQFRRN